MSASANSEPVQRAQASIRTAYTRPLSVEPGAPAETLAFRQLRHQTKNALQRMLCELAKARALASGPSGAASRAHAAILDDVERRLMLSASVSDALFGFTSRPDPFEMRLRKLAQSTCSLLSSRGQSIGVGATVVGAVAAQHMGVLLRAAHELVGNAVTHGLAERLAGQIDVRVTVERTGTRLRVSDDGWGLDPSAAPGGSTAIVKQLVAEFGGTTHLQRIDGVTVSGIHLPAPHAGAFHRA